MTKKSVITSPQAEIGKTVAELVKLQIDLKAGKLKNASLIGQKRRLLAQLKTNENS